MSAGSAVISTTAVARPGDSAVSVIAPGCFLAWTMTSAKPPKARRRSPWSASRLEGSPFPTPMISPGPSRRNCTSFVAVGTVRPAASTTDTLTRETASPSAWTLDRSGAKAMPDGTPVVSRLVSATTSPSRWHWASRTPGSHGTCQERPAYGSRSFRPWLAPFRNSSTLSQLVKDRTSTVPSSVSGGSFQCGNRWSTVSSLQLDW